MPTLGIFAKRPQAGAVKTRLAAAIGNEAAARFYEVSLRTLLTRMRGLPLRRVIAVAPTVAFCSAKERSLEQTPILSSVRTDKNVCATEEWHRHSCLPGLQTNSENAPQDRSSPLPQPSLNIEWFQQFEGFELWPQPLGDLGLKLSGWFDFACAMDDCVLVVGSDSPTLPLGFIEQALLALESADCVIGPALDGGYYLLGLRRPNPRLFEGVEWSSPKVLEQTQARAAEQQLRIAELPPWNDVDEVADLALLREQLGGVADSIWEPLKQELVRIEPLVSSSVFR